MFKSKNPEGIHYYCFFWNRKYKKYNAVRLTHIANKDSRRYFQVDSGYIKPIRLKQIDKYADNGITKERYINDVNGNNLHPNMGVVAVKNVSSSSATKIKKFGTSLYSRGRKLP